MTTKTRTDRVLSVLFKPRDAGNPFMKFVGVVLFAAMVLLFVPLLPVLLALLLLEKVVSPE